MVARNAKREVIAPKTNDFDASEPHITGKVVSVEFKAGKMVSSAVTLDDNVPMPNLTRTGVKLYPWDIMDVGQSFFVAGGKPNTWSTSCNKAGKKYGAKYATRKVVENGEEGVRVWRMA